MFLQNAEYERAVERCEAARAHFPASGNPYACLADVLLAQGRHEQALKACAEGMRIAPDEPSLFEAAGKVRMAMNQPVPGERMLAEAARLRKVRSS
jgi:cytochrome c-type biogenesis protein CcmH/NrfG